jgi:hypothetical protein
MLGPFLWLLLFCLIVKALGDSTPMMEFTAVSDNIQMRNPGEAFVDDSFLGCTSTHNLQELSFHENQNLHKNSAIANLHTLAQKWERLLFTNGGALNLNKSCWHLMAWNWSSGNAHLEIPNTTSKHLLLTAGNQTSTPISVPTSPLLSYTKLWECTFPHLDR